MFHTPSTTTPTPDSPSLDPSRDLGYSADPDETVQDKLDKLYELIDGIPICMFTTRRVDGKLVSRPMQVQGRRRGVDMLFFMPSHGRKWNELHFDGHANLAFLRPNTGEWVSISGMATVRTIDDPTGTGAPATEEQCDAFRELVRENWTSDLESWFPDRDTSTDPANDPRVALVVVRALSAQYATLSSSPLVLFDRAMSYVTGAKVPTSRVETRVLATPDMSAARVLASSSSKEAQHVLRSEGVLSAAPTKPSPLGTSLSASTSSQQPVSLGTGTDEFDDGAGTEGKGIQSVGLEGPAKSRKLQEQLAAAGGVVPPTNAEE